ncbi:hypothetical protein H5410_015070 [Solanum commersonii]|uniref:Uncharacterized protein n=1 Tax=Solanum commersonii TaxID=4109 RepID=A0A9J5ZSP3_SOLCO|nr:hypothetical protein H5410_015070 [Solanum commersonii]
MVSASHTNDDDKLCMVGEAQSANSNEEIDIDALLKRLQEQTEESSSNTTCKGKGKVLERLSKESVGLPVSQEGVIVYTCKGTLSKTERSIEILVSKPCTFSNYSRKEEYDIPQHLDLLNKWTIPKKYPRIIYQMGTFEKLGLKQVVNTTEETITIDSDHQTFKLLFENDLSPIAYANNLSGLPESFTAALRDGRNQNWKKSLIGTIQTSLAYGPVYFNDKNSLSSPMLNVKLHGYDYMPRIEVVCICYRIYYKFLHTLNSMCNIIDFKNETILIETNFGKSKVATRRPIRWDEFDFPQEWVIEGAAQPKDNINDEFFDSTSMHNRIDNHSMSSRISRSKSSYISPVDYIVQVPSKASTSQIRENYRCDNIKIYKDNIARTIQCIRNFWILCNPSKERIMFLHLIPQFSQMKRAQKYSIKLIKKISYTTPTYKYRMHYEMKL